MRAVAALGLVVALTGCESDIPKYVQNPVGPTVQTPTRLTLSAIVGQGDSAGRATVSARVLDQNNNGIPTVPVSFATSKGSLAPINISTDINGTAQTTLTSGVSSTVKVAGAGMETSLTVSIDAPLSVSLNVRSPEKNVSTDLRADLTTPNPMPPVRYVWDFGDGSIAATEVGIVTHTWREDGRVLVRVTVTDAIDRVGTASASVTVRDNPEPPAPLPPPPPPSTGFTLALTCSTQTALRVDCNAVGSLAGSPLPSSLLTGVSWDWGDGTVQLGQVARFHVYPAAGTYPVFVAATYGPDTVAATTQATAK